MATSEGIPSSIDIEFLELNDNPYSKPTKFGAVSRVGRYYTVTKEFIESLNI